MLLAIPISGLLLILFLGVHLLGVSQLLVDPAGFERSASALHGNRWLPPLELGLALVALSHLALTLRRAVLNRQARGPVGYGQLRSRRQAPLASLASRSAPWSGAVLLLFLAVHLAQLRLQRPPPGLEAELLRSALSAQWALALYVLAGVALGLHLLHGAESAFRSLGVLDSGNAALIRGAGRLLAAVVGGGFALLPVAVMVWPAIGRS